MTTASETLPGFLARGLQRHRSGDYEGALNYFKRAAEMFPELAAICAENAELAVRGASQRPTPAVAARPSASRHGLTKGIFADQLGKLDRPADNMSKEDLLATLAQEEVVIRRLAQSTAVSPLVSVIMPTFNRAYVIAEAIESVAQQTYPNWHLEICDDGSTDRTKEVVEAMRNKRISYRQLPKGNGAKARNQGLRRSKGEIITFLDSDNIWHPEFLSSCVGALARNPEAQMVYTGYIDTEVKGTRLTGAELKGQRIDYGSLFERNFIDLNTVAIRRPLYESSGGFDEALVRQQDWELILRYAARTRPHFLPLHLVLYRRNPAWSQVTTEQKGIDTRTRIQRRHRRFYGGFVRAGSGARGKKTRASSLQRIVRIKISAPDKAQANEWGDFHFANQLGEQLAKLGWNYTVDCQDEWRRAEDEGQVDLVIRGRHRYPRNGRAAMSVLWIISHPDRLAHGELEDFDHVFVASDVYADELGRRTTVPVSSLHQATAPEHFRRADHPARLGAPVLFVGNSRNEFRTMVRWANEAGLPLSLWGTRWEQFVGREKVAGEHVPNEELHRYYSGCEVLLNDHWDSMRLNGFISNRLFDASACACPVVTDPVLGLERIFEDTIIVASNPEELKAKVEECLRNPGDARKRAERAREIVLAKHTFAARAAEISGKLEELALQFGLQQKDSAS